MRGRPEAVPGCAGACAGATPAAATFEAADGVGFLRDHRLRVRERLPHDDDREREQDRVDGAGDRVDRRRDIVVRLQRV